MHSIATQCIANYTPGRRRLFQSPPPPITRFPVTPRHLVNAVYTDAEVRGRLRQWRTRLAAGYRKLDRLLTTHASATSPRSVPVAPPSDGNGPSPRWPNSSLGPAPPWRVSAWTVAHLVPSDRS
jgi:hypothetical protein